MKAGVKSTEFYLTIAATALSSLLASGLMPATGEWAKVTGALGTIILPTIYAYLRTTAKNPATGPLDPPK